MMSETSAPLLRSYLFAPGNNAHLITKALNAEPDAVVLDLEDAVGADQKQTARETMAAVLMKRAEVSSVTQKRPPTLPPQLQQQTGPPASTQTQLLRDRANRPAKPPLIYVRINSVATEWWQDDVRALIPTVLQGVRLGKAETVAEVRALDAALTELEAQFQLPAGKLHIVPTIETAVGLLAAEEIARQARVYALAFGSADFIKNINAELDDAETATLYARSRLVVASRAAGINPPIASVYTNIKDVDGLRATTRAARALGFFGRSCIHPAQLEVIHEVFTPSAEKLAEATAILAAFEQATAAGRAVTVLADGQFIDRPVVERAKAILALADSLALKN